MDGRRRTVSLWRPSADSTSEAHASGVIHCATVRHEGDAQPADTPSRHIALRFGGLEIIRTLDSQPEPVARGGR